VSFGGANFSYVELEQRVAGLTGFLATSNGIVEGDRVAYLGGNSPAIIELFFACARLGAVFVPLNSRLTAPQLGLMLDNADPKLLVVGPGFVSLGEQCIRHSGGVKMEVLADPRSPDSGQLDIASLAATSDGISCNPNRDQNIPVLIAYTSGTTGTPKGAVYTQDAITFSALNSNNVWNMRASDRVLTYLPMFHVGGLLVQTVPAFHAGASVIIHESFDAPAVLRTIEREAVTLALAPPQIATVLMSHPEWHTTDLGSLRCVGIGSNYVPPEIMEAWLSRNIPTQQNYGLTECVPVLASPWEERYRKANSLGIGMLYAQARVMDEHLDRKLPGEPGEIMVRGRSLFSGYWRNPEATQEAFIDGWFRTGDIAYTDEDGYFYMVERIKNIVIVGSSNVYPADLERVLDSCPAIAESAVVGCPDPETGEALVACVLLKEGQDLDEDGVRALFVDKLAPYQHPKHVLFMQAFPRTSLGKIQKSELKRQLRDML